MSNIDFTKPVETIDGTPVQIISTEGRGRYPILGYIGDESQYVTSWSSDGFYLSDKSESDYNLRNKATWRLPAPPDGQQWHRYDWKQDMLPNGYRPLLVGETGAYEHSVKGDAWGVGASPDFPTPPTHSSFLRTTRPLPQQQQQPQEPWAAEKAAFAAGETIQYSSDLKPTWTDVADPFWVNPSCSSVNPRYRIKPKPQKVPLEPCDVPPGSLIRNGLNNPNRWYAVLSVGHSGLATCEDSLKTFEYLKGSDWQIKRPTDTEWQPCWKEI